MKASCRKLKISAVGPELRPLMAEIHLIGGVQAGLPQEPHLPLLQSEGAKKISEIGHLRLCRFGRLILGLVFISFDCPHDLLHRRLDFFC